MGAACTWHCQGGWTGRRYNLGNNKEAFGEETYAIFRALKIFDQGQESGRQYTIFADSTVAINIVRTDTIGQGQQRAGQRWRCAPSSEAETTS